MKYEIREMQIDDYARSMALWKRCEGIGLSSADDREPVQSFLAHNPGLCFIALSAEKVIGTVLCGFDGRRGALYHLAVDPAFRHQGIGEALVTRCLEGLQRAGGQKCHLMVFQENTNAQAFYAQTGWYLRDNIVVMSKDLTCNADSSSC